MSKSHNNTAMLRIVAILLPPVCVLGFFLIQNNQVDKNTPRRMNSDSQQQNTGNRNEPQRRPVPSLFRSPDAVAADAPIDAGSKAVENSLVATRSDADTSTKTHENPFIIGSKRDKSAGSTLPSRTTAIAGDNEDRVRMIINGNEVQFAFDDEGKQQRVSLVGSFNSWNSASTPMRRESRHWKVNKRLAPIRHEFKFVSGNGKWYPEGDNLILNLENRGGRDGRGGMVQPKLFEPSQRPAGSEALVEVTGEHQGRVEVISTEQGIRFRYRDPVGGDYMLLLGDFNSWNTTVAGMRREGSVWTAEKILRPGNYAFKFLGPDESWFPQGDNLTLSYSERIPPAPSSPESKKPPNSAITVTTESKPRESEQSISIQRAREYLNDAGLYEGKPGVWFFPQSNRLVIRQYGRISKDPKIKKALKRLGDRLPHPAEMENPPPQRR